MTLRKSTKIWPALLLGSVILAAVIRENSGALGCAGILAACLAILSGSVLVARGIAAAFRLIVRRLTLRLAFSYFLIGIVPIPLLATLLFVLAYLLAHQIVATRVRREVIAIGDEASAASPNVRQARLVEKRIAESDAPWLRVGEPVPWVEKLDRPRPLLAEGHIWLASSVTRAGNSGRLFLVPFGDSSRDSLQQLADRTGYAVYVEHASAKPQVSIEVGGDSAKKKPPIFSYKTDKFRRRAVEQEEITSADFVRPKDRAKTGDGWLDREWILAVYPETCLATFGRGGEGKVMALFVAKTSPRNLASQLFAQGAPGIGKVFWIALASVSGVLLLVYFVALAIAFTLVGSIARNVNRLTRATRAIAGGDFSVRVKSKSRDQIGDLARSFDGMAASIEHLLLETTKKERLESEIAVARTIQQKLLPSLGVTLPGLAVLTRFEPVAELGGDYYDFLPMPGGRTAIAVGDVSGHGLPTGLLVAMAKAGLSTLIESGVVGSPLFSRLNELIHRSTDSRNYMTLALLAYDVQTREGELTNAGQLAPYRISGGSVESLSLPSFPLGIAPRSDFPTRRYQFSSGDRIVFLTDGFVEAAGTDGEPFGFERLETLLRTEAESDAIRLRDTLLCAVAAHTTGLPPEDDRTLVILTIE